MGGAKRAYQRFGLTLVRLADGAAGDARMDVPAAVGDNGEGYQRKP